MFRVIVLACVLAVSVSGQNTHVSRCTNNPGDLPMSTQIVGCITPPCNLPQLQNAVMNVVFRAPRNIRDMRTLATAFMTIGVITIPIPYDLGPNALTCNFLTNASCPVQHGQIIQYTLRMFIESIFPVGTSVNIEFRVVDENNRAVFCFRTGIRIVAATARSNSTLAIDG